MMQGEEAESTTREQVGEGKIGQVNLLTQIVEMVAVGDALVTAIRAMDMILTVGARVSRRETRPAWCSRGWVHKLL